MAPRLSAGEANPALQAPSGAGTVGAIVVAAGSSQRMGGRDKGFALLGGHPILAYSLTVFQNSELVNHIVLVLNDANLKHGEDLVLAARLTKVREICLGGARRQDSVGNGLKKLPPCDWVFIHDGARPFVTQDMVAAGLQEAHETGAAVPAVPVKDTIKIAAGGMVRETPARETLWVVQTPQVFRLDIIARAYDKATDDVTDDSTLVEKLGYKVKLYPGSYDNIKITTTEDLALAELILKNRRIAT